MPSDPYADLFATLPLLDADNVRVHRDQRLGAGAFGAVFRGEFFGDAVAVKLLALDGVADADAAEFAREVRVHAQLRHPGVVGIRGCVRPAPGELGIVMELCAGSLRDAVRRGDLADPRARWGAALQIVRVLAFLHRRVPAVMHSGVKPENVLVAQAGGRPRYKLADFGVSVALAATKRSATLRGFTPAYAAPEMLQPRARATPAADVFALGSLLFFIFAGRGAFDGYSIPQMYAALLSHAMPEAPPTVPAPARAAIEACWAADPAARPTAAKLLTRLEKHAPTPAPAAPISIEPVRYGTAKAVRDFAAFCGAATMPEAEAAHAARLKRVGPLCVAKGAELAWLPAWKGPGVLMASLSACGVLCAGGYIKSNPLTVTHLPTRRIVQVRCGTNTAHGFVHGRELFVAQFSRDTLWHAPVSEVLAGRTRLADFEQMPLAAEWGWSARLDAAPAGWVAAAVCGNSKQHLFVDLATRTSRLVKVGQKLPILGGFVGITVPRMGWAACTNKGDRTNAVFAVSPDGATQQIADGTRVYPMVLPSASRPVDLARAAVLDYTATFSVGGVRRQLCDPVQPAYQSLVRLHRDVFLCWDRSTRAWVTVRIVVP